MNSISRIACVLFVNLALLAGCGGGAGTSSPDDGSIRLLNMTSDTTGLDLLATNSVVASGVAPYTASPYAGFKSDTYTLDVRPKGGTSVATATTNLSRKGHQTVVASTSGGTMSLTVLTDDESTPGTGKAKVRIFNTATADIGNVDVYIVSTACSALASSVAQPMGPNVSGLQSAYKEVVSSATPFNLCVTGPGDKADLRLDLPSLVLSEKRIVTVILGAGAGGYLLNGVLLDQQSTATPAPNPSARVRVAASVSPSVPATVEVNGTRVSSGLNSPSVGGYVLVPAGPLTVKVNTVVATPATPYTALGGADVTILLTGPTPTVTFLLDNNAASSSPVRPVKLRVVNGLNGATGTATLTVNSSPVGMATAFGTASEYTNVSASAGLASLEVLSGTVSLYRRDSTTFETGRVYTLFLLGNPPSGSPLPAYTGGFLVADR